MPKNGGVTVRALRDLLQAFDDDTPVLVSGYESGYDDPSGIALVTVTQSGDDWYHGRYEEAGHGATTFKAVVIPR